MNRVFVVCSRQLGTSSALHTRYASAIAVGSARRLATPTSTTNDTDASALHSVSHKKVTKIRHGFEVQEIHRVLSPPAFKPLEALPKDIITPSGWTPVIDSATTPTPAASLPFHVSRSKSGNLPVYTEYRHGRNKIVTILRKYIGDETVLFQEVRRVVGQDVQVRRYAGRFEIDGNVVQPLALWLRKLGF
jgi:large subunit ribosomal protein L49